MYVLLRIGVLLRLIVVAAFSCFGRNSEGPDKGYIMDGWNR